MNAFLAELTNSQTCLAVFVGSIFAMWLASKFLPFDDNWPDGYA